MERPVLKVCGWMSAPGARWTLKRVEMRVERVCCGTIQWSNAGRHSDQGWARGWEGRSDALPFVLCGMRVGRGRGVVQQLAQPVLEEAVVQSRADERAEFHVRIARHRLHTPNGGA